MFYVFEGSFLIDYDLRKVVCCRNCNFKERKSLGMSILSLIVIIDDSQSKSPCRYTLPFLLTYHI